MFKIKIAKKIKRVAVILAAGSAACIVNCVQFTHV